MMKQVDLMLRHVLAADAKTAQRAESGIDAVDRARLRGERFHELTTAADERARFLRERTGIMQRRNPPGFRNGERVSVECDH